MLDFTYEYREKFKSYLITFEDKESGYQYQRLVDQIPEGALYKYYEDDALYGLNRKLKEFA